MAAEAPVLTEEEKAAALQQRVDDWCQNQRAFDPPEAITIECVFTDPHNGLDCGSEFKPGYLVRCKNCGFSFRFLLDELHYSCPGCHFKG